MVDIHLNGTSIGKGSIGKWCMHLLLASCTRPGFIHRHHYNQKRKSAPQILRSHQPTFHSNLDQNFFPRQNLACAAARLSWPSPCSPPAKLRILALADSLRRPHPRCSAGSPYGREAMDGAVSAASQGRKGASASCRRSTPSPTAVQEELLVNIKVNFFPLLALELISCYPINFPPKRYPEVADLEPQAGSGGFCAPLVRRVPVEATFDASAAITSLVSSNLNM
jgi:hypothetical protein